MHQFLKNLASRWKQSVHPRLMTFVATVGVIWLGICLLTLIGLAHLADEVLEQEAFVFDETILLWIHQFANPVLDHLMLGITQLGNPQVVIPLSMITFFWLWRWQRYRVAAIFALNCLGGAVLSTGLKLAFSKARPQLWPQLITETTYSFPSGHALGSMVLYGFLAFLLAQQYPQRAGWIYGLAGFLIAAIGLSRLYLGVHWPTDVLAGYGVGLLWVTLCAALLRIELNYSGRP